MISQTTFLYTMIPLPIYRIVYKYIYDSVMKQLQECYTTLNLKRFRGYCKQLYADSYINYALSMDRMWLFKRCTTLGILITDSDRSMYKKKNLKMKLKKMRRLNF